MEKLMASTCCDEAPSVTSDTGRKALVRRAFLLEWFTVGWMALEAVVAIGSGIGAHSRSLVAFGADSVIELLSAGVLLWRLDVEMKRGQEFPEAVEARASRIAGGLLFALAAYVLASAAWSLWRQEGEEFSIVGLAITAAALPTMWWLARAKLRIADAIGSRALRADAIEAVACGWLSAIVFVGLLAQLLVGAWWIDGVASLAILYLLVREGLEAWRGEDCCDDR
jgi:divalent metal cation (Fe/Co/Zn/Cd) transporter